MHDSQRVEFQTSVRGVPCTFIILVDGTLSPHPAAPRRAPPRPAAPLRAPPRPAAPRRANIMSPFALYPRFTPGLPLAGIHGVNVQVHNLVTENHRIIVQGTSAKGQEGWLVTADYMEVRY